MNTKQTIHEYCLRPECAHHHPTNTKCDYKRRTGKSRDCSVFECDKYTVHLFRGNSLEEGDYGCRVKGTLSISPCGNWYIAKVGTEDNHITKVNPSTIIAESYFCEIRHS